LITQVKTTREHDQKEELTEKRSLTRLQRRFVAIKVVDKAIDAIGEKIPIVLGAETGGHLPTALICGWTMVNWRNNNGEVVMPVMLTVNVSLIAMQLG
jgi:hypothetical protein